MTASNIDVVYTPNWKNIVVWKAYAMNDTTQWFSGKWETLLLFPPAQSIEPNQTEFQWNSIELYRTQSMDWVRLSSAIEWNRTHKQKLDNRTQLNSIHWIVFDCRTQSNSIHGLSSIEFHWVWFPKVRFSMPGFPGTMRIILTQYTQIASIQRYSLTPSRF